MVKDRSGSLVEGGLQTRNPDAGFARRHVGSNLDRRGGSRTRVGHRVIRQNDAGTTFQQNHWPLAPQLGLCPGNDAVAPHGDAGGAADKQGDPGAVPDTTADWSPGGPVTVTTSG